jgi:hypothetical protein
VRQADNLPPSCADVKKSGALTSRNPVGLFRPVMGQLCLFLYDNEKEKNNKEIYAIVKKSTITKTIRLNRLHWFGHVQRMEENTNPKSIIYEFGNKKIER